MISGNEVDVDEQLWIGGSPWSRYRSGSDFRLIGDGESEIQDFYEDLLALISKENPGVVGSGDTFYDEFCKAVDDFDRCFAATGAEKGSECVKVDLSAGRRRHWKLEAFAEELVAKAN